MEAEVEVVMEEGAEAEVEVEMDEGEEAEAEVEGKACGGRGGVADIKGRQWQL